MHRLALCLVVAAACGGAPASKPSAPTVPSLAAIDWIAGDWAYDDGKGSEHWVATSTAVFGIVFMGREFEVMQIDVAGGALRLSAMPYGGEAVIFTHEPTGTPRQARFVNPRHDDPTSITYTRTSDDHLVATLDGPSGARTFAMTATTAASAPELEKAVRADGRTPTWSRVVGDQAAIAGEDRGRGFATVYRRRPGEIWRYAFEPGKGPVPGTAK